MNIPNRREGWSEPDESGNHLVTVNVHPETQQPCEIFISTLDRFDSGLQEILHGIARTASHLMQELSE